MALALLGFSATPEHAMAALGGSFAHCLAIHPLSVQLDKEPGGKVKVPAFADDFHFMGPPKLAVAAMARWGFLYGALLQGQINQKKCLCYSPGVVEALLREVGLPAEVPFTSRGTRVPGAPVGSDGLRVDFARAEAADDIAAIGRMPSLQAQHCLLQGAIQHKLYLLWRNISGGELGLYHGPMPHGEVRRASA